MARVGEIIDGKYEILRQIGRGGMSVVYLAMDKRLNKQWAVKEYRQDSSFQQLARESLLREAKLMKKLDHPRLPRIVDIIENASNIYIVMDYIEGEPLDKVLENYGAQPQEAVIEWGKQLAEVLDYLHTLQPKVIYRDMKPANIMLKPDGTIRLFDFGIAKELQEGEGGGTTVGTRGYAAPEQFSKGAKVDERTDIYALGVTLYHLVTGKNPAEPPFEIYPIRHWNPNLSSGLEWLIQKCTQLNPKDRYQSCAEVSYVLNHLEQFETAYQHKRRQKVAIFCTAAVLTVVFALTGTFGLLMNNKIKNENYEAYLNYSTADGYKKAIDLDEDRPDAYKSLARKWDEDILEIVTGEEETGEAQLAEQEIVEYFSEARLEKLRKRDATAYLDVNYRLGMLYWQAYEGEEALRYEKVFRYFGNILGSESHDGLSEKRYNLTKALYLTAFFSRNKILTSMANGDEIMAPENDRILEHFQEGDLQLKVSDGDVEEPYKALADSFQYLLEACKDSELQVNRRMEILKTVSARMYTDYKKMKEYADLEEMCQKIQELILEYPTDDGELEKVIENNIQNIRVKIQAEKGSTT